MNSLDLDKLESDHLELYAQDTEISCSIERIERDKQDRPEIKASGHTFAGGSLIRVRCPECKPMVRE